MFVNRLAAGRRFASTLVLGERNGNGIDLASKVAVSAAGLLGHPVTLLVPGSLAKDAAALSGVTTVLHTADPIYDHPVADSYATLVADIVKAKGFTHVVAPASSFAKDVLPRAAGILDVQPISDVISIDKDTYKRPIYAGNAIATVRSKDPIQMMTVRTTAFEAAADGGSAALEEVPASAAGTMQWVQDSEKQSDKPQLASAARVVSGGRGLGNGENFETVLQPLCDKLGAAMGASRAAVDAGFVPNDMQIGQTGKVVAPELYIAVGISGAIQHLAGMKDSKTIVAINKDADAPIFQVADYGLVDDLFKAVPELTSKV